MHAAVALFTRYFLNMNKELFVSIVIRTRNRRDMLQKCLDSILAMDYSNYNIVIVDDRSDDDTREYLQEKYGQDKRFVLVRNEKKISTAFLYNLGIKNSIGEIIAFTDDDCIVYRDWLKELARPFAIFPDLMAVGGLSYKKDTNEPYGQAGGIFGCNMAFRSEVFKRFSFDPNLKYSHYHDEADLIKRIKSHNFKLWYVDKAIVRHYELYNPYREEHYFKLGAMLNAVYIEVKNKSFFKRYQYCFLAAGWFVPFIWSLRRKHNFSFWQITSKFLNLFYDLFVYIPIRAGKRHRQEEMMFKKGVA
jgi:glycosyltransferase involved in cell wall biosynthesis